MMNMTRTTTPPTSGEKTFTGSRLYIGNVELYDSACVAGSYTSRHERGVRVSYTDASGAYHEEYFPHERVFIEFSLRRHDVEEHRQVSRLFDPAEITITYWDDVLCEYVTDTFLHETIEWINEHNPTRGLEYQATEIALFTR